VSVFYVNLLTVHQLQAWIRIRRRQRQDLVTWSAGGFRANPGWAWILANGLKIQKISQYPSWKNFGYTTKNFCVSSRPGTHISKGPIEQLQKGSHTPACATIV